jgi:hypothetical protein
VSWNKLIPFSGFVAVVLVLVGLLITGDTPGTGASTAEVKSFYTAHDGRMLVSGALLTLGGLFFLVFFAAFRSYLRQYEGEGDGLSAYTYAGGILVVAGLAVFAAISFALGDVPDKADPAALQTLNVMSENFFPPFALGVIAFLASSAVAAVRTGALPRWIGWVTGIGAIFAVSPLFPVAMVVLGLFTLVASVRMARADGRPLAVAQVA